MDLHQLKDRILDAGSGGRKLNLCGGGSKQFLGREPEGEPLDVRIASGVISYDPAELVVTVHAGTRLAELQDELSVNGQMLPFESPHFGADATVGGTVACGLSGPARPWAGSLRDYVLGVRCLNGRAKELGFGGQVMKNVAGYDASRLIAGSMGTLGVILEVSFKVLPVPETQSTVRLAMSPDHLRDYVSDLGLRPLPITAISYWQNGLYLRLAGSTQGVRAALDQVGGDIIEGASLWDDIREQRHEAFNTDKPGVLWRLSLPSAAPVSAEESGSLMEWGGAVRWVYAAGDDHRLRQRAEQLGGSAMQFAPVDRSGDIYHPLSPVNLRLHKAVKHSLDPLGVFNPGRMYREF